MNTDIGRVIEQLDEIIAWSREDRSALGYFPALYRRVTVSVAEGIEAGRFEDGERMAHLDVIFAQRYIDAFEAWHAGRPTTAAWAATFRRSRIWPPIVLQHLLGGMNAHINLDLGIAAATVAPGADLPTLKADFDTINDVLSELVQGTKDQLATIWRPMGWLDRFAGTVDDILVDFSMKTARDGAWRFAERLAALPADQWGAAIAERDAVIGGRIAGLVYTPAWLVRMMLLLVRATERGSVVSKLETLVGLGDEATS